MWGVQAAEVLLMMRPEGEASSDFQEYTLVALFSLAAHLAGGVAAETASLPAMARYYKQDLDVLQQVCCHALPLPHCHPAWSGLLKGATYLSSWAVAVGCLGSNFVQCLVARMGMSRRMLTLSVFKAHTRA